MMSSIPANLNVLDLAPNRVLHIFNLKEKAAVKWVRWQVLSGTCSQPRVNSLIYLNMHKDTVVTNIYSIQNICLSLSFSLALGAHMFHQASKQTPLLGTLKILKRWMFTQQKVLSPTHKW